MEPDDYDVIDSGNGRILERFGTVVLDRPRSNAVWQPSLPEERWAAADGRFLREGRNEWAFVRRPSSTWEVSIEGIRLGLQPTDFGHVGAFPEHRRAWGWMGRALEGRRGCRVLNLFAYTGGATLAAARAGAEVVHLDASKKSITWANENAALNGMSQAPIRWICDDVIKFLKREARRGTQYDGIILDPPNYGRGTRQEVFKIEEQLSGLLTLCREVLAPAPRFLILTCHTPGYTPLVLRHLLAQSLGHLGGRIDAEEMVLEGAGGALPVPVGAFAGWVAG